MKKVLFVCLGNICRSPAAEAVMRALLEKEGLDEVVSVASAGTGDWHVGELPDKRMRAHGKRRGYELVSRAQQVNKKHFHEFDYIVPMDTSNERNLRELAPHPEAAAKIMSMCSFATRTGVKEVPDPYYGGAEGFELVLDILEDACEGLLGRIKKDL